MNLGHSRDALDAVTPLHERPTLPEGLLPDAVVQTCETIGGRGRGAPDTIAPPLAATPWVMLPHSEILQLGFDHREGFLLSLIDGRTDVGTLIEIAAMPRIEVLRLLVRWAALDVIAFADAEQGIAAPRRRSATVR